MNQKDISNFYMIMGLGFCISGLLVLISFTYNFAFFFIVGLGFFMFGLFPEWFKLPDLSKMLRGKKDVKKN